MIERNFSAWDFVQQKPKPPQHTFIMSSNATVTINPMVDNLITLADVQANITTDTIVIGEGLRVDEDNRTYISNLTVTDSIDTPPVEGGVKWDFDRGELVHFVEGQWAPISYIPRKRKKPVWPRIKRVLRNFLIELSKV